MKLVCCILLLVPAAHCFQLERQEEIKRTLRFPEQNAPGRLMIDNTLGSITVSGYDGSKVELMVVRKTRAESEDKFREAAEDVLLEVEERRDRIEIVVNALWRRGWGRTDFMGYRYYGYEVEFDFVVRVPRKTEIYLRTFNDGDISVTDVEGDFEVKNVNGDVEMKGLRGSGRASTVNGSLHATFVSAPVDPSSFHTVNGEVEVSFPGSLSADLVFKTFQGKVYTEFDVTPVSQKPAAFEEKRKKKIYRSGESFTVRVGKGGPMLAFETLNGNIQILKHQ